MRKIKQTLLGLAVCLAVSSCGTTAGNAMMKVRKGMSQSEVKHALGTPEYRRFNQGIEQWEYLHQNLLTGQQKVIIVDFADGEVVNMDSFNADQPIPPVEMYPPVVEVMTPAPPLHQEHPRRNGQLLPRKRAMQPAEFDQLYNKVKRKAFKDDQLELLSVGVPNHYFSCSQCARLMALFTWDDDKMKVLNLMIDRLTDKQNGEQIVKTFDSMFKQDEVRKRLGLPEEEW